MLKRLFIPGLAISALAFNVNPAKAGTFTLDNYNNALNNVPQRVNVGRLSQPPRTLTQGSPTNPLAGVFGGARTLRINQPLTNPQGLVVAASIFADPINNQLTISNGSGVISNSLARYDGNGIGLNNLKDARGISLGDWASEDAYDFDFFALKINSIDTRLNITFKIEDSSGKIAQLSRTVRKVNEQIVIDNPTSQYSVLPANTAIFTFTEFLNNNNINFKSIRAAQIEFTGQAGVDATIDFIQGVEVPEPSLGIATIIAFGIGIASVKRNKNVSEEESL